MPTKLEHRFYWVPFPGCWQCVLYDAAGKVASEGMAATWRDAMRAAERNHEHSNP